MHQDNEIYDCNLGDGYYTGIQTNLRRMNISPETQARLHYLTNNLGDCYQPERCQLPHTMQQEREAVERMAEWLALPADECWGYVGGGSSLGNLQGMWMGSVLRPEATLVFTDNAHYSIHKFATCLRFNKVKMIRTNQLGEIDLADLKRQIKPGEPVVIVLTAGTTMTSAYDPIAPCLDCLAEKGCAYYLHLDAALGGLIVPFIDQAAMPEREAYTFANPAISSTTVSMHKVLGAPMPANIFIARQAVVSAFKQQVKRIAYFGDLEDITVYGSRDGFRAALIHERLYETSFAQLQAIVMKGIKRTHALVESLNQLGLEGAFARPGGLAVVIPVAIFNATITAEQQVQLCRKYRLVRSQEVLHLYVMAHVTQAMCDEFLNDCELAMAGELAVS